jgi:hypothetical protein
MFISQDVGVGACVDFEGTIGDVEGNGQKWEVWVMYVWIWPQMDCLCYFL